jgi:hypothetical protein
LKKRVVIVDAISVILGRLSSLSDGPEVNHLREQALVCLREVDGWKDHEPTPERRNGLMKEVLDLHVRTRRLGSWNPPR